MARVVGCEVPGCEAAAQYKVAAAWQGNGFSELKTYGFACPEHLGTTFRAAEERRAKLRTALGESVGATAIYRCEPGKPGWKLQRLEDLEGHNRSWGAGMEGV